MNSPSTPVLPAGKNPKRWSLWVPVTAFGVGVIALVWLYSSFPTQQILSVAFAEIQARPDLTMLAIILLMVAHNVVPIPAEVIAMTAGALLGPIWGSLAVWTGAMLGACLAFWVSRMWGRAIVHRVLPRKHFSRLTQLTQHCTWRTLLGLRLIPVISFNLVNYGAGLTSVPWSLYLWTTAVGILPITIISVCLGAHLIDLPMDYALVGLTLLGLSMLAYKRFWH